MHFNFQTVTGRVVAIVLVVCFVLGTSAVPVLAQNGVTGFGPERGKPRLPGFGPNAKRTALTTEVDRATAQTYMQKYDRNGDGFLDESERSRSSWLRGLVPEYDYDRDGNISIEEMVIRWTQYRLEAQRAERREAAAARAAEKPEEAAEETPPDPVDAVDTARLEMCTVLAADVIAQHDSDGNEQLEFAEWPVGQPAAIDLGHATDANGDRLITRDELATWFLRRLPSRATSRLVTSLRLLDADGDGQIAMHEFAKNWTDLKIADFQTLDQDNNGVISPAESRMTPVPFGAIGFFSREARMVPGKSEALSSIVIDRDIPISDIDIRVSITKKQEETMQLFLVGPDGKRTVLFKGEWLPWKGDYVFEGTLIDDEAAEIASTLASAPLPRRLQTGALRDDEPGLYRYYGQSARGTWQLVVKNLDEHPAIVRQWSLWVKP